MAKTKPPLKVLPFCSVIYKSEQGLRKSASFLEKIFSKIKLDYGPLNFSGFTKYYSKEMGGDLLKKYFFFTDLQTAEGFHEYKLETNEFENKFTHETGVGRVVNLDPGYITEAKFVLFTTKNRSHRIYVARGIYGEVQLEYRKNSFIPLHYSHKDYKDKGFIDFINKAREYYRKENQN